MYWIYAIYNSKNNKFYIGQTENLQERLRLHNNKTFRNSYAARFSGKWKLIYKEVCYTRSAALKKEKQLKSYQGREFIKKLFTI